MRDKPYIRQVGANNHYCLHCALFDEKLVDADGIIWVEDEGKAVPLCNKHINLLKEEDQQLAQVSKNPFEEDEVFWTFSEN